MDWQLPIVLACVLLAGGLLVRRFLGMLRGSTSGCGKGCGNCGVNKSDTGPLVTLQGLPPKKS